MSAATTIAWTDATWNPVRGCTRVSEGCRHCYAERTAARFSGPGQPYHGLATHTPDGPRWTGQVRLVPEHLADPLRWRKPRRVFVNSMSDLFHEALPDAALAQVWRAMEAAPHHTFQVLTKRPARMRDWTRAFYANRARTNADGSDDRDRFRHVWLGVSVEDQATADARIPLLLDTPAAVRFVSVEPLLGPVDLRPILEAWCLHTSAQSTGQFGAGTGPERWVCDGCGVAWDADAPAPPPIPALRWVIVGGESGPGARRCRVEWIESVVAQCRAAGVPCFVKQLGARPEIANDRVEDWREQLACIDLDLVSGDSDDFQGAPCPVRLADPKGADPAEWPVALRVQEFPA